MSSFVVDKRTINRILSLVNERVVRPQRHYGPYARRDLAEIGFPCETEADLAALGLAMYKLNIAATSQRYPDDELDGLPGTVETDAEGQEHLEGYRWERSHPDEIQAVKSLECWLYQCAEGDAPERELYKCWQGILHRIAVEMIGCSQAYENAEWG